MEKQDLRALSLPELESQFQEGGLPKYRAGQVFRWAQARGAVSFEEMSDLPLSLRQSLSQRYFLPGADIELKRVSKDGTVKYLFRLFDGAFVESVLMRYHYGLSICISTQVGCKMGCSFCATGQQGFTRNLSASEMIAQIQAAQRDAGERISHVVLMGMGEPLDNLEQVLRFLELVSCPQGLNLGKRHISLSTCGLVPGILALADSEPQFTLSVSLHAPNDEIRDQMMPVNRRWNVEELLKACKIYSDKTRRRISFEYAMIRGVNDSDDCARELAERLRGILAHVNLIPVNDVTGTGMSKSERGRIQRFAEILESRGVPATVRRTLGADIEASCGQLKGKRENA